YLSERIPRRNGFPPAPRTCPGSRGGPDPSRGGRLSAPGGQVEQQDVEQRSGGRLGVLPGRFAPAPALLGTLGRGGGDRYGRGGAVLGPVLQDQVVQVAADALAPPGGPDGQLGQRERPALMLGGELLGQRRGQVPPPGRGRAQRHAEGVPDEVAAVPRLGQHEPRLPPLPAEPPAEPAVRPVLAGPVLAGPVLAGAVLAGPVPGRRRAARLGPQSRDVLAGPGGLRPAEKPQGYLRRGHGSGPSWQLVVSLFGHLVSLYDQDPRIAAPACRARARPGPSTGPVRTA